ncbi:MAG: hypothetical protein L6406_11800 [Desulfobacterales bacterium]|nr:hypothetical protein [Desulfobacterales bacterium]
MFIDCDRKSWNMDESLWDGWLRWMNRMIRFANGMKTLRFQDESLNGRMIRMTPSVLDD